MFENLNCFNCHLFLSNCFFSWQLWGEVKTTAPRTHCFLVITRDGGLTAATLNSALSFASLSQSCYDRHQRNKQFVTLGLCYITQTETTQTSVCMLFQCKCDNLRDLREAFLHTWVSSKDIFLRSILNVQSIAELFQERYLIGQFE